VLLDSRAFQKFEKGKGKDSPTNVASSDEGTSGTCKGGYNQPHILSNARLQGDDTIGNRSKSAVKKKRESKDLNVKALVLA